jgi:hypothetical protein
MGKEQTMNPTFRYNGFYAVASVTGPDQVENSTSDKASGDSSAPATR